MSDHTCSVTETGVCAFHEAELERRNSDRERVGDIKQDIAVLFAKSKEAEVELQLASNFRSQAKVLGLVLSVIWSLQFVYTFNHKQDSVREFATLTGIVNREDDKLHKELVVVEGRVDTQEQKVVVIEDRYLRLINDMDRNNGKIQELIEIIRGE